MLLYYITDRKSFGGTDGQQREALLRRIADAARAGVDYIQLREKDLPARELERLGRQAVSLVRNNSATAKLLINSRADVALAVGADGVHLPAVELAASEVRAVWSRCRASEAFIGVSAHTAQDILCAHAQGSDLAVLAPIFEKVETGALGIGLEALRATCTESELASNVSGRRLAVFALGGVTLSNARACVEAGATGVAGIRLFQQGNLFETVQQLRNL